MKNARCFGCGLVIQGRWRNGPPKKCPRCGFAGSKEVLKKIADAKLTREAKP